MNVVASSAWLTALFLPPLKFVLGLIVWERFTAQHQADESNESNESNEIWMLSLYRNPPGD